MVQSLIWMQNTRSNQTSETQHGRASLGPTFLLGKSKRGLSKGGLGPKGANWAKRGPFGAISALPPWLWGAEELVPIDPEKAPIGPEKAPICPEKARFSRNVSPPIFSENLGLKTPFVSPRLDFPHSLLPTFAPPPPPCKQTMQPSFLQRSPEVQTMLSAPNHKSQIASDLKSRSPNRKNFPEIAVSDGSNRTFKSCDL